MSRNAVCIDGSNAAKEDLFSRFLIKMCSTIFDIFCYEALAWVETLIITNS